MKEIEVKVIEIDKKIVLAKLRELGAKKIGSYDVESSLFDTPNHALSRSHKMLRLRKKGKYYLTLKEKCSRGFSKQAEEHEIEVSDLGVAKQILQGLGFIEYPHKGRHRTSFKLGRANIELEEFKEIPPYIEIEAQSESEIKKVVRLFGFKKSQVKNWDGSELFKHYGLEP